MLAIYKREMLAYFTTPIGYIFLVVFLAFSGFVYGLTTLLIASSDTSTYFTFLMFVFVIMLPLLTMKSLSEERRTRTEQLLLTSPVSLLSIVAAKYLAALTMFAGALLISCVNFFSLYKYAEETPNGAVIIGNLIAIFFVGMAFLAIGIFISSLTENQVVAALGTIGVLAGLLVVGLLNSIIDNYVIRTVLSWLSIYSRYINFTYGIFDIAAAVYYLSICLVFLFLTVRNYERRRWN